MSSGAMVKALGVDTGTSKSEVSQICKDLDQEVATWLRCHRRAFEWFGGVVRRVMEDYSRRKHETGGYEFVNKVTGGRIPKEYIPSVDAGCQEAMQNGRRFDLVILDLTIPDGLGGADTVRGSAKSDNLIGNEALTPIQHVSRDGSAGSSAGWGRADRVRRHSSR